MKQITIATYNICHGHYAGYDWARIAAAVQASGADLLGFQEIDRGTHRIFGGDNLADLVAATGLPYSLFIPAMDYDGGQYGTAILSRYPIEAAEIRPLPSAGYEPRAFGCVTVKTEGRTTLTLLNTHLSVESRTQQDLQMMELACWISRHIPTDSYVWLTGDFNTEDFTAFSPLTAIGLALVNGGEGIYKTFRGEPLAIDNILYRKGCVTPVESGMVDSDASDHNLLWCRFSLQ